MTPDVLNALFELTGALLTAMNTRRVIRDKGYAGIYWPAVAFFWAWGAWNLFYYPHLEQWWSFTAGVLLFAANLSWLGALWWYGPVESQRGA